MRNDIAMKMSVSIKEFKKTGSAPKRSILVVMHICVVPMCLPLPLKGINTDSPNNANNKAPKNVVMNLFR
jgi:hypothetical protein